MLESKLYLDGERAGQSCGISEMSFQGCVQKCEFGMESTTTVLSRNVKLAVKGLTLLRQTDIPYVFTKRRIVYYRRVQIRKKIIIIVLT